VGLAGARDGDGVSANSPRLLQQVVDHCIEVVDVTAVAVAGLVRVRVAVVRVVVVRLVRVRVLSVGRVVSVVVLVRGVVARDVLGRVLG